MPSRPRHRHRLRVAAVAAAAALTSLVAVANRAEADDFVVTNTNDGGAGSLRDALFQAQGTAGPDTISVPVGTITLTTDPLGVFSDVTVTGAGAGQTVIVGPPTNRVFNLQGGLTVVLEDLTIQGGSATGSGGGVNVSANGSLTIRDSVVSGNSATTTGGGIHASQGSLTVERSLISDNDSGGGGGISTFNTTVSILDSTIEDNLSNSTVTSSVGGGLRIEGGSLVLERSTVNDNIAGNSADDGSIGGGIHLINISGATDSRIVNSTVSANFSYDFGGGITVQGSEVSLVHATVARNTAAMNAAGIGVGASGTFELTNTLLHDNQAATDANCGTSSGGVSFVSNGGNLSDDATCTVLTQPTDRNDDSGTTLGDLQDNGGETDTHALSAGSSAIDAVTCATGIDEDQRTTARPQNVLCDIGAFEFTQAGGGPTTTATTVGPTTTTSTPGPTTTTTTAGGGSTTSTTTRAAGSSTTLRSTTTTSGAVAGSSLVRTGSTNAPATAATALILVLGGAHLVRLARTRRLG